MSPEVVFSVCTYGVGPAWLLIGLAPNWVWTQRLVHAVWIPVLLAGVYVWAFVTNPGTPPGAGFESLEAVMLLFTSPHITVGGWVHYLIFDLFIGAWEVRDARRHGIAHGWVVPCLFFTLMVGPIGLTLYLALRFAFTRSVTLDEGVRA